MPTVASSSVSNPTGFGLLAAIVGGMTTNGLAALLGTLVTNASLSLYVSQGLTIQEAYVQMGGLGIKSQTEIASFAVVLLSGAVGGFVSAHYGRGRHLMQALVAGAVGTTFFISMSLGPTNPQIPPWYVATHLALIVLSSLFGGYLRAKVA